MKNIARCLVAFLFLTTIAFTTPSCKKSSSTVSTTGPQDIYTCYISQHLTKEQLAENLAGDWQWISRTCRTTGTVAAEDNIKVNFSPNGTFVVSFEKAIRASGTWTLTLIDGDLYGLDMSTPSEYLSGRILICGHQLLFNDSYRDGCDNSFERVN